MGIYNDVYKKCPHCGGVGYSQIKYVGRHECSTFDLDKPEELADMCTKEELTELFRRLSKDLQEFSCKQCGRAFPLRPEDRETRVQMARDLFCPEE